MSLAQIHVTRWGSSGPRVVMVHGGAQGGSVGGVKNFFNQQHLANEGWQLLVPDRPGHGLSPCQGWPDDAELDGAWTAELLGAGAHLVGHSFGGAVALAAAARRPDAVRSLTLIEPAMHAVAIDDPRVRKFVFSIMRATLFSLSAAARAERLFAIIGIPPEISGRYDKSERARIGKALRRIRIPKKKELVRELGVVRATGIPLFVVTGGWSEAFNVSSARVAVLGGGRHVIVRSPHHFPQIVSGEFSQQLSAFMRAADARRAPVS
jgi:pimeloyl-ACP methyl ester carboxylesterase